MRRERPSHDDDPEPALVALVVVFCPLALLVRARTRQAILLHVAAGAAVLAVTFALFAFGWIGGGDAKLAAATALWLGFDTLPDYLMLAADRGRRR